MDIPMESPSQQQAASLFSAVLIHLLRGPLYALEKPQLWNVLIERQAGVRDYMRPITLSLYLDEAEGYAFLRQVEFEGDREELIPRLIRRRPLGMSMSVLCLLLRKWLVQHDSKGGELRVVIERSDIHAELGLYIQDEKSEAKKSNRIDKYIAQAIEWGLVRELKGDVNRIEIMRITKAVINAEWLGDLDERLQQYRQHVGPDGEGEQNV